MRNTALLATALLVDLKLVTKSEPHLIVDPSKIQRAREKVMKEERLEAKKDLEEVKVVAVFIDGRRDKTKAIVVDEDGDEFARTIIEEHITVTDPNRYLTHVTPDEGSGAKGEADKVIEFLTDIKQLENVKVIGGGLHKLKHRLERWGHPPHRGWEEGEGCVGHMPVTHPGAWFETPDEEQGNGNIWCQLLLW